MKTELKPCPFCGGEADIWETDRVTHPYQVMCLTCYCGTDASIDEETAIEAWNRRTEVTNE